ncbi:MAG: transposase [Rhizomicrobium sp.]|jgi:REP element-mobilizing transposase RayT
MSGDAPLRSQAAPGQTGEDFPPRASAQDGMACSARIVLCDHPHHVTARGNRREAIFFENGDHDVYRTLLAEQAATERVEIWAYCLMPNHVHLIAVPREQSGLGRAICEAHRRYTNLINECCDSTSVGN